MSTEQLPRIAWSVAELAKATGLGRTTIHDLIRQGMLPGIDTGSSRVLVPDWAVQRWIAGERLPITHQEIPHEQ
jgi:excisionase family DNA binding protein